MDKPTEAKKAHDLMVKRNGESDWHASASYEDSEVVQALSIRPDYAYDDNPFESDVVVHALAYDDSGTFAEVELRLKSSELARLARQYLSALNSDQTHYSQMVASSADDYDEDEDEDEDEDFLDDDDGDEEEDDDDGDEDDEADDDGDGDDDGEDDDGSASEDETED